LAYQLVLVGTPGVEPSRRVEFPIAKDATTYESEKGKKQEGMRPDANSAIDGLKPYKGGNDALWRIHELDNIDKHRRIFSSGHDYLFMADWLPGGGAPYWAKDSERHFGGLSSCQFPLFRNVSILNVAHVAKGLVSRDCLNESSLEPENPRLIVQPRTPMKNDLL
jgi:hypothetical protein